MNDEIINYWNMKYQTQQLNTCSKLNKEALEQGLKHIQS